MDLRPRRRAALADLGADVIKIEPPAGDPQRGLMNLLARAGGPGANPFVEIPNRGKRSMTLDLARAPRAVRCSSSWPPPPMSSSPATCPTCGPGSGSAWTTSARSTRGSCTPAEAAGAPGDRWPTPAASISPRAGRPRPWRSRCRGTAGSRCSSRPFLRPGRRQHDRRGDRHRLVPPGAHRRRDRGRRVAAERRDVGHAQP